MPWHGEVRNLLVPVIHWQDIPEFALQISGGTFQCQPTSKESMKLPYIALYLPSDYSHDDLSQIMAVSLREHQSHNRHLKNRTT